MNMKGGGRWSSLKAGVGDSIMTIVCTSSVFFLVITVSLLFNIIIFIHNRDVFSTVIITATLIITF
jgi:hypothetical protein